MNFYFNFLKKFFDVVFFLKLFFDVDHFKSLYMICYNIASLLCFGFLAMSSTGS